MCLAGVGFIQQKQNGTIALLFIYSLPTSGPSACVEISDLSLFAYEMIQAIEESSEFSKSRAIK